MASDVVQIDGGVLEGGGQILRNAAALSCILGLPICVNNIRAGRDNPGLRPQHLSGLQLIRDLSHGQLTGGNVSSTNITLCPNSTDSGSYLADTKTAGSTCLLIQAALPCLCFARGATEVLLRGGTNAEMAPQIDYFTWVLQPILQRLGVNFECDIRIRGYYPRGGGEVLIKSTPIARIQPVELLDAGRVTKVTGRAFVAGTLPIRVAGLMADVARNAIQGKYRNIPVNIEVVKETQRDAIGNGSGIILMAETSTGCRLAGSALGGRNTRAEDVGAKAADELLRNLQVATCVDEHLQDQLIIFMALASGKSRVRCGPITLHTETAIHVAKLLTQAKFNIVSDAATNTNIIECDGIGLQNKYM